MRPKTSGRAARPLSVMIAGGAVLVGVTLLFGTAPDQLPTATAAPTPTMIRFTVNEGTNISITRPSTGQWIIMDLHGFLYRLPPQGGQAVRITDVLLDAARPEISPNGQRIAFQGYDATRTADSSTSCSSIPTAATFKSSPPGTMITASPFGLVTGRVSRLHPTGQRVNSVLRW